MSRELAKKLMTQEPMSESRLPTAIFGSISAGISIDTNRPPLRVGLWPIVSEAEPETAMAVANFLSYLLENWRDVRVYRLFVNLDDIKEPDMFVWSIDNSQFDVDDWQLDDLDENIAVWGNLEHVDGEFQLTLEIEDDSTDTEETTTLSYTASDMQGLLQQCPTIAAEVASEIGAGNRRLASAVTLPENIDDEIISLLKGAFRWEVKLLLALADVEWTTEAFVEAWDALQEYVKADAERSVAGFVAANALAHALLPALEDLDTPARKQLDDLLELSGNAVQVAMVLGDAMFRMKEPERAQRFAEQVVAEHGSDVHAQLLLAETYFRRGQVYDAVDGLQDAIENDVVNADLFGFYAYVLRILDLNGYLLEDFVIIDADDYDTLEFMAGETAEAYRAAIEEAGGEARPQWLRGLILQSIALEEAFWDDFKTLAETNLSGEHVRGVIDDLYDVDDLAPGIEILELIAEQHPNEPNVHLNLAALYLLNEQPDEALNAIDTAEALSDGDEVTTQIDQLRLQAMNPDFEFIMGEITDKIGADVPLADKEIDFLQNAIENAPSFTEAYVLLAKAYIRSDDGAAALETLMDAQETVPNEPEVIEQLARLLWDSGEGALAVDYLNRGLNEHPNDVSLLALTGRYLFDDGQLEAARVYMARAEAISPRNRVLAEVKRYISEQM